MGADFEAAQRDALARVAANVRHWRRRRALTQAALAEAVGVEPLTIRSIEGQRQRPRFALLAKLAVALQVDISELFRKRAASKRPLGRPRLR